MKATLEFNLDNPEDRMAHLRCVKATDMAGALWRIMQLQRTIEKTDDQYHDYTLSITYEAIRGILDDNGINLDELIE
jgi:hypothetical protein